MKFLTSTPPLKLLLSLWVMTVLAACSSAPPASEGAGADASASTTENALAAKDKRGLPAARTGSVSGSVSGRALPPHLDKSHPITAKRSVYFDLNDHTLPPEAVALLQLHGMYLAANPEIAIRIEGHTDELGGVEYNLALGQRRANSVANALKVAGAQDSQLEAVSFGKEKPRALGHDEDSWAENRRADLVYPND